MPSTAYHRVLLKLSGEALMGEGAFGVSPAMLARVAGEIRTIVQAGVQVGLVMGGGNYFRGVGGEARGMTRAAADDIGMLATVMNALALREALADAGVAAEVLSAVAVERIAPRYRREDAISGLAAGRVMLFAAGTGNPFFSTDTAAVLRALEVGADIVLKATKVDGVYDRDPHRDPPGQGQGHGEPRLFRRLSLDEAIARGLGVMDATAFTLCREHHLPLRVFNINRPGCLTRVALGADEGTLVSNRPTNGD